MPKNNSKNNNVASAVKVLNDAIKSLDSAVSGRMERENQMLDAEAEVQRMGADRTRLAESLDGAEERSLRLENTNREVSRRLVDAMESIRSVLDGKGNA